MNDLAKTSAIVGIVAFAIGFGIAYLVWSTKLETVQLSDSKQIESQEATINNLRDNMLYLTDYVKASKPYLNTEGTNDYALNLMYEKVSPILDNDNEQE